MTFGCPASPACGFAIVPPGFRTEEHRVSLSSFSKSGKSVMGASFNRISDADHIAEIGAHGCFGCHCSGVVIADVLEGGLLRENGRW